MVPTTKMNGWFDMVRWWGSHGILSTVLVLSACSGDENDDPAIKFREIPTTGSTYLAYSPGIMVNVFNFASAYFIAQIPIYRDFNGDLEQQISYLFGVTKSF